MTNPGPDIPQTLTTREANRAALRSRLLDSAEELFAARGYFGVSVRDITDHAGTRLAAISEQFGGKEALFRAVLVRRIQPLNDERRALLAALPASGPRARRLRAVIEAFTEPLRQRAGNPGWDNYFRFIAQLANSGHPIRRFIADDFNAIAADFIAHLQALFPAASEEAIYDAYLHLVAATMYTYSNNLRLDSLTQGRMHADDIDKRHQALLRFAEGGIHTLATAPR
ncbi:TetR family transcriptional regulator [Mycolicibacterium poriferae]|jgi:AcrR family transcriptional regulator|uniref:TetR family transcriptional regulator n=1 Tax=Mycolicibacterium poriferae TaxID=39694 RepID=A0A6N4VAR8_9MYCO|nr:MULTISPECIES: TetR/AcrR family transcriptional regulator [Mycolicibacterium]MCG7579813.1 TetR family transcriptional regulator [Mycolicibacterium sp. OfavD-34-C]MCV7261604.1 TetR/AcrR family transcriptional regulator [Mycolicibacterium poriferae]BBX51220.1 TetR family transcriptional regulator [Mycolicibacterium poriferae]